MAGYMLVRTIRPTEPLPLGEILFPLRYDIVMQEEVFTAWREFRDKVKVIRATRSGLPYRRIALVHKRRRELGLAREVSDWKAERKALKYHRGNISKLIMLYRIWCANKWDVRKGLLSFKKPLDGPKTTEGFPAPPGVFLAHGQHRTAALWGAGVRELAPEHYIIKEVLDFKPPDFTRVMVQEGILDEAGFCDFARLRFDELPEDVSTAGGLVGWSRSAGLDWLARYVEFYFG